jgi:hypothetical protein
MIGSLVLLTLLGKRFFDWIGTRELEFTVPELFLVLTPVVLLSILLE